LIRSLTPNPLYSRIKSAHSSVARSCRSLESKGLVELDGIRKSGAITRIKSLRLDWEEVGAELIRRTHYGRKILKCG